MACLVVVVEDPVVVAVEGGHCHEVVVLHKGYDPAWAPLVDLRGEADRLHLEAPVVVAGVGNFHIAFASEDVVAVAACWDMEHLPRVAWDDLHMDWVAVDHQLLVVTAVDQGRPLQGAVEEGIPVVAVVGIQEVPGHLAASLRYACPSTSMAVAVFLHCRFQRRCRQQIVLDPRYLSRSIICENAVATYPNTHTNHLLVL